MTTPKEALERLRRDMLMYIDAGVTDDDLSHTVKVSHINFVQWHDLCDEALASLQGEDAVERVALIDKLRANEGDSVTILCDNPDFNGQPDRVVVVNGEWTDWQDRRFGGDTLVQALRAAVRDLEKTRAGCMTGDPSILKEWRWEASPFATGGHVILDHLIWRGMILGTVEAFRESGPWYGNTGIAWSSNINYNTRTGAIGSLSRCRALVEMAALRELVEAVSPPEPER